MEVKSAIGAFAALSQETRLSVFRELISAGETGRAAGELSDKLGVLPNTLSTNLSILAHAGLVRRKREGRSIRYFAHFEGIRELLGFLMQDCCGGKSDLCQPVLDELACVY
jgi:DNA-binding transcriptional ArsR family regulator